MNYFYLWCKTALLIPAYEGSSLSIVGEPGGCSYITAWDEEKQLWI